MDADEPASPAARGAPAWAATWVSILIATLVAVIVLARLSADGARAALEDALADHLVAVAGAADGALHDLPLEAILAMGGERSLADLAAQVDALAEAAGLRGLALVGPEGRVIGHQGRWIPAAAERDLIAVGLAGSSVTGPLYRDAAGELYQTAYRPLTGHPGWVVAIEGSAATLGAADALVRTQWSAGAAVVALAVLLGAALAAWVSRPLRRLSVELAAARPGTPPSALGRYGSREVRAVSAAARELLAAIRARDAALGAAHRREIAQLTRMAAEIAHEVGNPLNAVGLSVQRLRTLEDPTRRGAVLDRVQGQLHEMEAIVERLRDLTRPLHVAWGPVDLDAVVDRSAAEIEGLAVVRAGAVALRSDAGLLAQILRNLLRNAAQAGARRVEVALSRDGDRAELRLVDDGPGVPEAEIPRLFDWFHTTRATGSGLGLPVSRRIAEALGGDLELVCARPATFRLRLPCEPPP